MVKKEDSKSNGIVAMAVSAGRVCCGDGRETTSKAQDVASGEARLATRAVCAAGGKDLNG
jgi:hypothetical protein